MAFIKLGATLVVIFAGLRLKLGLGLSVLAAGVFLGFAGGLSPLSVGIITVTAVLQREFVLMAGVMFFILALSKVQEATGQNKRLVEAMSRSIPWPRLRLVIFPALIGFLPVPGGALFSCPMLEAAASGLPVEKKRLAILNYWFRHIWELACPLYPGYLLVSSLLGLPLFAIAKLTFPFIFLSMFTGWFFCLRDLSGIPTGRAEQKANNENSTERPPLRELFINLLPLLLIFGGLPVFYIIFKAIKPDLPSQYAFMAALLLGVFTALFQGRGRTGARVGALFFNKPLWRMFFLIFSIFAFKDLISATNIVGELGGLNFGSYGLYLLCFFLPFICGALMGVMVGYVGASVPILLSLIQQGGFQNHTAPLVLLALVGGNCGQLLSPLHICLAVTCEYFKVRLANVWPRLSAAVSMQLAGSIAWIALLAALGVRF